MKIIEEVGNRKVACTVNYQKLCSVSPQTFRIEK